MNLSPQNVENTFLDCLYTDQEVASLTEEEIKKQATIVEGIVQTVGFNPTRLETHKQDITDMLQELPDSFMKGKGGGMSFLNACINKNDELWTGEHRIMDQLFMMGIAIKKVQECMPRQMWSVLPGGMPYYTVDINA